MEHSTIAASRYCRQVIASHSYLWKRRALIIAAQLKKLQRHARYASSFNMRVRDDIFSTGRSRRSLASRMAGTGAAASPVWHWDLEQPACVAEGELLAIGV
jgi:hypothetical protein